MLQLLPLNLTGPIQDVQAVVPVLIGPAATLVPILVGALGAFLAAVGRKFLRLFTPVGMKEFVQFFWHQKVFTMVLVLAIVGIVWGLPLLSKPDVAPPPGAPGFEWSNFRGEPGRSGAAPDSLEPTTNDAVWANAPQIGKATFKTFFSSPAIVGDRLYIAGCDKGPMADRGGVLCFYAGQADKEINGKTYKPGDLLWSYTDKGYLATYSSPSVAYKRNADGTINYEDGYVVCGEGLHFTESARVFCLNLKGELLWQYQTKSHVESSPAIEFDAKGVGRVYIGAGDDGYYCFELEPTQWEDQGSRRPKPIWHTGRESYPDCETSPAVESGVFYAGLGVEGNAVIALEAATGKELWRVDTPSPVFTAPTIGYRWKVDADGKREREKLLFIAMGNANVLEAAETVKAYWPNRMKEKGFDQARIDRLMSTFRTDGEVWCVNISNIRPGQPVKPDWKVLVDKSVLAVSFAAPQITLACTDIHDALKLGETVTQQGTTASGRVAGIDRSAGTITLFWDSGTFDEKGVLKSGQAVAGKVTGIAKTVDPRIYFGAWDGKFRCVSIEGKELAKFDGGSAMPNPPVVGKDYVYIGTASGALYCLDAFDLRPLWQASMGSQLVSSPVLGNGHIYVGTMGDGVRCIGHVKPLPPSWTSGSIGGSADRTPLPKSFLKSGRYPPVASDKPVGVTAGMMPLPQIVNDRLTRFVYAPVIQNGKHELIKFKHGELKLGTPRRRPPSPVVWSVPFDRQISVAPAALDREIFVVAGGSCTSQPDSLPTLHAMDVDGKPLWQRDLLPGGSGRFAIESTRRRMYVWAGPDVLACVDLNGGKMLWSQPCPGGQSVGDPTASDGLVVATTEQKLIVIDSGTGSILWSRNVPGKATAGPVRTGDSVYLPTANGVYRIKLAGAVIAWHAGIGRIAQPLLVDAEKLVATTADGKLHVLSVTDGKPLRLRDEYDLHYDLPGEPSTLPDAALRARMVMEQGRYMLKDGSLVDRVVVPTKDGYFRGDYRFVRLQRISGEWHLRIRADQKVTVASQSDGSFTCDFGGDRAVIRQHDGRWYQLVPDPKEEQKQHLKQISPANLAPFNKALRVGVVQYQLGSFYMPVGLLRVIDQGGRLAIQEGARDPSPLFSLPDQWFVADWEKRVKAVGGDGGKATVELLDGKKFNAVLIGGQWYNNESPASRVTIVSRQLAAVENVDPQVCPVLMGDQIVCGIKQTAGTRAGETDLMVVSVPDRYQVEALPEAGEKLPLPQPPPPAAEPVDGDMRQVCTSAEVGQISLPLVLIEGNLYAASADGVVYLTGKK